MGRRTLFCPREIREEAVRLFPERPYGPKPRSRATANALTSVYVVEDLNQLAQGLMAAAFHRLPLSGTYTDPPFMRGKHEVSKSSTTSSCRVPRTDDTLPRARLPIRHQQRGLPRSSTFR
jgi:hypothetical protein